MSFSEVTYEDNHIIVVNKLGGALVQGDKTGDRTLADDVKSYLKKKYNKPGNVFLGIVHRIDRPVSGLVLFARTSKALSRLSESFRLKKIHKTYWAITANLPSDKQGMLRLYLRKNQQKNKSFVVNKETKGGKLSELEYKIIASSNRSHLLELNPITGRHHQIRTMLSHIGCPIKGDLKYGAKRSNPDGNISLHAKEITFIHPVKKEEMSLEASLPNESLWNVFREINL